MTEKGISDYRASLDTSSMLSQVMQATESPFTFKIPRIVSPGEAQFDVIKKQIQQFEQSLDNEHEVAVKLASFGSAITMSVSQIFYDGLVLIFDGFVNENRATLIQNMSQLSFLLLAVRKVDPESPKKMIGFSTSPD